MNAIKNFGIQTISILIITYNRPEDTLDLLKSIQQQENINEHVGEILLLNNNSSISYKRLEEFIISNAELPVQYIKNSENSGVAGGRNLLIKKASFPYLLILDDDVLFADNNAIEKIAALFSKHQYSKNNTAVITLNIYYFEPRIRQKSALPHKHYHEYKDKDWFLTYYFTGAAHLMKKEMFIKTGYYPEDFFYGMEEYDLSYRILNNKYTIAYDSSVLIFHKESPKGRVPKKEKIAMMWLNKSKVAWRYLPKKYFYSTTIMWSIYYLNQTNFDLNGFIHTWRRIISLPSSIERETIGIHARKYLKKVKARLWY